MKLTAPSFADLTYKMVDYIGRNANLSIEKVWTTMMMIYGDYVQELGWDLKKFRSEIFPAVYEEAHRIENHNY